MTNTDQHLYLDVTPGETVILKAVFAGNGFSWEVYNNTITITIELPTQGLI